MSIIDEIPTIHQLSGGIAVTAGAGTGKTYIQLVNKIQKSTVLIMESNPSQYCLFSASQVDAANEQKKNRRIIITLITVGTIHSCYVSNHKRELTQKDTFVLDNGYQKKFVSFDIFKELKIDYMNYNKFLSRVDLAKNMFPGIL